MLHVKQLVTLGIKARIMEIEEELRQLQEMLLVDDGDEVTDTGRLRADLDGSAAVATPPEPEVVPRRSGRRTMSPEERAAVSLRMKRSWAKRKRDATRTQRA